MPRTPLPTGRRLLFSGILLLFMAVFFELALQVFYFASAGDWLANRTGAPIFEEDENRCYRLRRNLEYSHHTNEFEITIYTNGQGMRTDSRRLDYSAEKPEGVYRILLLGPSFAFGWGNEYEESYGTLIGDLLRETGLDVEVLNLGTPAQGPEAQLCWLQKVGYRFDPDMVLQTTYGSAITTVVGECPEALRCPTIEDHTLYTTRPTLRKKAIAKLKNLGLVFYGFYLYNALRPATTREADVEAGKELYSERARESLDAGQEAFVGDFHRYAQLVRRLVGPETQVVFLFLPVSYLVHPEDAGRWSHLEDPDPMGARRSVADAAALLQGAGVELIDTTPTLIARAEDERLYYWLDIHLTPAGNRVVAETAATRLSELIAASAE